MMGNHVILDHGHGEYSALLHLRPSTIAVKEKQKVKRGDFLGEIGFSGDSFFPDLHCMLMNGRNEFYCEGLPAYFRNFSRIIGSKRVHIKNRAVDTGDILEVP
jgi:murein DD-endopeptidase MepM/ murein hydrolase activator NlpD